MEKTKIDWCDSTWNPVTGCLHGCEYCYARGIANRFGASISGENKIHELDSPYMYILENENGVSVRNKTKINPYPFNFEPTFHAYRLNEYINKKGRNIFVCSMSDLFGDWVPPEWRKEVFEVCRIASQHNYLFLTKNPGMYAVLDGQGELPTDSNMWFGTSVTTPEDPFPYNGKRKHNLFLSIEPLLADFSTGNVAALKDIGWVIIGAETGHRKGKVIPKRIWIEKIVDECRKADIPVFMKSSLSDIWGEPLIQEFPEELKRTK